MKKWFVMAMIVCLAAAVQAAEGEGKKKGEGKGKGKGGDVTKEQFVANAKKQAEAKGAAFEQAKVEARFEKMDKNKDGVLSGDEKQQPKKKPGEGKKKGEGKKQADEAAE